MYSKVESTATQSTYQSANLASLEQRMPAAQQPSHNSETLVNHLARLSHKSKWIYFTAQCQRPKQGWAKYARFTTSRLIHLMPSRHLTEKEVIIKALQSGNASAVVASERFSLIDKRHLKQRANQLGCELYFADELKLVPSYSQYH
ncbi:SulA-like leucine-rich domain-containing protein [Vibrio sp. SCSIO 43136]|uniref:SulA-like leucine-rich domain-containing protein n=1 Tax=Vibrio sp. SCSIO 43136 TaxID=2819101 RepID=UPI002074ED48|nr:SulA-like leucine-rich domain-containing protein [Vibrio sp. SCSIO 43136]USD64130.1 hypothetical protein J4N39_08365 [Vibrio sp. SCSIO 43136]